MTDAGKFEQLAMPILRELYAPCETLAHLGVNAAGKTIPNPVDAFCLAPGSDPPQYVMAAFTTVSVEKLKEKWLLDPAIAGSDTKKQPARPDGDLIKAAKKAAVIRQSEPSAQFILYLCTNRRLSVELMEKVYVKGREFGIDVCLPEQSQLSEFLDTKPVGQWLRQRYLGIDADQLSRPLLRHLGIKSSMPMRVRGCYWRRPMRSFQPYPPLALAMPFGTHSQPSISWLGLREQGKL